MEIKTIRVGQFDYYRLSDLKNNDRVKLIDFHIKERRWLSKAYEDFLFAQTKRNQLFSNYYRMDKVIICRFVRSDYREFTLLCPNTTEAFLVCKSIHNKYVIINYVDMLPYDFE